MSAKYDAIGVGYNSARQADPYLLSQLKNLLSPEPAGHYLEIGCGSGNYSIELSKECGQFTGVDPSIHM